jgi:hypothetical protein
MLVPQPLTPVEKQMVPDPPLLAEPPYGHPAALVFSDPLTPLIVLCDYILIGNSYAHETTMQPCRTFWEEGFVGRLPKWYAIRAHPA